MEINTKIQSFKAKTKTNHAIHPTLVTTYPVVQNEYAADLQAVITAEDLFAPLRLHERKLYNSPLTRLAHHQHQEKDSLPY